MLGGSEAGGAGGLVGEVFRGVSGRGEVDELYLGPCGLGFYQNVVDFYVAVGDVALVHVLDGLAHLAEDVF